MTDSRDLDLLAVQASAWTVFLGTTAEICAREAERGRRVGFVFLDIDNADELPVGAVLGSLMRRLRMVKVKRLQQILQSLGVVILPVARVRQRTEQISSAEAGINSPEDLRDYRVEGAALGIGALSSLINQLGDPDPDLESSRQLVDGQLNSAYEAFVLTRALIDRYHPRELLVFNGRLATAKGVTEAARIAGVGVWYCERGATDQRYYFSARPPQSSENARKNLHLAWATAGTGREEIAAKFFTRDRGGVELPASRFLKVQQQGLSLDPFRGRRLVYFVSSDDEYAAVEDGLTHPLFDSQRAAVQWLIDWVQRQPDTELVIRIHPRMQMLSARERGWWEALEAPHVRVLSAEHPADSYELARGADKVLCYRSSMGPEATYMGKVAILLGDVSYRGLDCAYEPSTIAELEQMLTDQQLTPKPAENCLPYGYERLMRGAPYRFYEPIAANEGTFCGQSLEGFERSWPVALGRLDKLLRKIRDVPRRVRSR